MNQKQSLLFDRWPRCASRKPWMVFMSAIMHLMGNRAWAFPAPLDRLLPRISVEAHLSLSGADGSDG